MIWFLSRRGFSSLKGGGCSEAAVAVQAYDDAKAHTLTDGAQFWGADPVVFHG